MRIPAHLVLSRHRIFYLRWPIPKALHPLQKRSHLKLSLQTRDPQQALQAARALCYLGNLLLEQGSLASMTYAEVKAILTRHFSDFMEKTKAQIAESGPLPSADVDALENSLAAAQSALDHGTSIRWGGSDRDLLTQFIGQYNLSIEPNSPQFSLLRNDLAKAYRAYCHAALEFSRSYETYDFTSLPAAEAFRASISESSTKGISLEEMAEGYFRDAKKAERWTARTEMERSEHLALLYEVWGKERDVGSLSKVDAGVIKSLLHQYPKNRNKRPETRKRPLAEALAAAGDQTLSMNTINKYLQTCSGLFHWGNKNGHVNENIFEGLTIARGKKQNRKLRNEFSREQITLLLNEVVCDPSNKIGCHKRPWRKWAPLIAVFTGARLNEIAQLEISDIRQQDDIWYFDINDNGPRKSLKNASSARKIPMHSKLIHVVAP
jgi:site-specific recombinase XerD